MYLISVVFPARDEPQSIHDVPPLVGNVMSNFLQGNVILI